MWANKTEYSLVASLVLSGDQQMSIVVWNGWFDHWNAMCRKDSCMLYILLCRFLQYIPRNMHTVFALLCFVVVIHWLIFRYPSGLLHWHYGNPAIAPVPAKQPWWIWIDTSCEFIMSDCITTTKQSTTKPCVYFLGYTVCLHFVTGGKDKMQGQLWCSWFSIRLSYRF